MKATLANTLLPLVIFGDGEGRELIETHLALADSFISRTDGTEFEPLVDDSRIDSKRAATLDVYTVFVSRQPGPSRGRKHPQATCVSACGCQSS